MESGSFTIEDADLSDTQSVSHTTATGYLGNFTATLGGDTNGDGSGRIDWDFNINDADIDYLGAGETLTQTYTVTVTDSSGATVDQNVVITLTGTNDAPTTTSTTLTTNEDVAYSFTAADFGFGDVDVNDSLQSVTITRIPTDGILTLNGVDVSAGQQIMLIDVSDLEFTSANNANGNGYADLQFSVSDGSLSSTTQTLTFNVIPVDDAPTATDSTATFNEDTRYTFQPADFGFSDADSSDSLQSVTITQIPAVGALVLNGINVLANQVIMLSDIGGLEFVPDNNANGNGYADLQFTVSDGSLSSAASTMTFNVTAVNDVPTVTSTTDFSGALTELSDGNANENTANHSDSGRFNIADVEGDTVSVTSSAAASDYQGSFTASVAFNTTSDGVGSVDWEFNVADSDIDYLAAGQTLTQTYTVTVSDSNGGTVDQDIVITLTGTNDAPTISSTTDITGAITEITDGGSGENATVHVESGSFAISDDATDNHTVSVSANGSDYRGSLRSSLNNRTGQVDWTYEVDDAYLDDLTAGETVIQTYTVQVDDGNGGVVDQDVNITLTGRADTNTNTITKSWNFSSSTSGLTIENGATGNSFGQQALQFYTSILNFDAVPNTAATYSENGYNVTTDSGSSSNELYGYTTTNSVVDGASGISGDVVLMNGYGHGFVITKNDGGDFFFGGFEHKLYNNDASITISVSGYNNGGLSYTLTDTSVNNAWNFLSGNSTAVDEIRITGYRVLLEDLIVLDAGATSNSNITRSVTTESFNTSNGGSLSFKFLYGHSSNSGDTVESNEYIKLEYSTNGGSSWSTQENYSSSSYFDGNWHTINVNLPSHLQQENIQFRIAQNGNSGVVYDHWAIDDLNVTTYLAPTTSNNDGDSLEGAAGAEHLIINHDNVTATGNAGGDTFDFNTNGTATDIATLTITDFSISQGDRLELNDILVNPSNDLTDYFAFQASGSNTIMTIRAVAGGPVVKEVTFENVNLLAVGSTDADRLNWLVNNNHLVHDTLTPPVAIDLDGDGLEIVSLGDSTTIIDTDGDGDKERTAWIGADDGFIITDLDGDGTLSSSDELFIAQQTAENDTDLEALATLYDTNKDGVLNAEDEQFDSILVFQDKNQDGKADVGEVSTLKELNIQNISVVSDNEQQLLSDGSLIHGRSTFTKTDGTEGIIGDVSLANQQLPSPETVISNTAYDPATRLLTLSGSRFNDILVGDAVAADTELREILNWDKLSYNVDGAFNILFSEGDVLSARVINDNELLIELTTAKAEEIDMNTINDYANDDIEVTAGFIHDLVGNVGPTDAYSVYNIADVAEPQPEAELQPETEPVEESISTLVYENDILIGDSGVDTFIWNAGDESSAENPAEDIISNFELGTDGDILNLKDLLVDENSENLDQYLHFEVSDGNTTIEVATQAGGDVTQKIQLQGVDFSTLGGNDAQIINNLLDNGNLQID